MKIDKIYLLVMSNGEKMTGQCPVFDRELAEKRKAFWNSPKSLLRNEYKPVEIIVFIPVEDHQLSEGDVRCPHCGYIVTDTTCSQCGGNIEYPTITKMTERHV